MAKRGFWKPPVSDTYYETHTVEVQDHAAQCSHGWASIRIVCECGVRAISPTYHDALANIRQKHREKGFTMSEYRILVTASRGWRDPVAIQAALRKAVLRAVRAGRGQAVVVVHGGAPGGDRMAGAAARTLGLREEIHLADWEASPRAAGVLRNVEMVKLGADECLAFILDNSPGAIHCARTAEKAGIRVVRDERVTPVMRMRGAR